MTSWCTVFTAKPLTVKVSTKHVLVRYGSYTYIISKLSTHSLYQLPERIINHCGGHMSGVSMTIGYKKARFVMIDVLSWHRSVLFICLIIVLSKNIINYKHFDEQKRGYIYITSNWPCNCKKTICKGFYKILAVVNESDVKHQSPIGQIHFPTKFVTIKAFTPQVKRHFSTVWEPQNMCF